MTIPVATTPQSRRIHIIGGPGSGKTTLARRLATKLDAPCCNLDEIGYEGGAGAKRPLDAKLEDVSRIAAQPAWVTEGIFLWWTDELLREADTIIWLDIPWRVAAWRIVKRHVRASLAGTNRHRGIRNLMCFLVNTRGYHNGRLNKLPTAPDDDGANSRAATAEYLVRYKDKVIRYRNQADVLSV